MAWRNLNLKKVLDFDGKCVLRYLPQVSPPDYRLSIREKFFWTGCVFLCYQVLCRLPLYGPRMVSSFDPLFFFRGILASDKGTVVEFGLTPFLTVELIFHLLVSFSLVSYNPHNQQDKLRRQGQKKVLELVLVFFYALVSTVLTSSRTSRFEHVIPCFIRVVQLCCSGMLVHLLEDLLSKGYGFDDHNYHLFLASNICEHTLSRIFSPKTVQTSTGPQKEGALIAFFHAMMHSSNKLSAMGQALYRSSGPNLFTLVVMMCLFLFLIYVQGYHIRLFVKKNRVRHQQASYPIKLFYTSSLPILLQCCLLYNLYFFSQLLCLRYVENPLVGSLARWVSPHEETPRILSGGLIYYLTPPSTLTLLFTQPIRSFLSISFFLLMCFVFSTTWLTVSGNSSRGVAKSLRDQGIVLRGHREASIGGVLNRYIPTACVFSGLSLGALSLVGNLLGGTNSGLAAVIVTSILCHYYDTLCQDYAESVWNYDAKFQ